MKEEIVITSSGFLLLRTLTHSSPDSAVRLAATKRIPFTWFQKTLHDIHIPLKTPLD